LVLDEEVSARTVVGGLVIAASVALVTRARRTPPSRRRAAAAVAAAALAVLGGCGGSEGDGACGPVRQEPLDQRSVHVLPGGDTTTYRTDPPTSGPHLASPSTS